MQGNKVYWQDRSSRAENARKHHEQMLLKYADEIAYSVTETKMYGGQDLMPVYDAEGAVPECIYENAGTDAAFIRAWQQYQGKKIAVLDFASYQSPGGKFMEGSSAQEESLCHVSTLYECLAAKKNYYTWNTQHKNHALYTNRALYVPNVVFDVNGIHAEGNVIACAAPNRSAFVRYNYGKDADEKNHMALESRIRFIKAVAEDNNVDVLILGAFGCGVFGQDQDETAALFKDIFAKTSVSHLIYAVPVGVHPKNAEAFQKIAC